VTAFHVVPVDDLKEHPLQADCWCHPTRAVQDPGVIIHNSLDGREVTELCEEVFGEGN
jgi:hypothetical protein